MSATRILVLGVVRAHGQTHGYEVRRDLLSWGADKWANVKTGSIYHALRQMAKEQLLTVVDEVAGTAPDRTVYRMTEAGDWEFLRMVANGISEPSRDTELLSAAFAFLPALPRGRALSLVKHRVVALESQRRSAELLLEESDVRPEHVDEMYRLWQLMTVAGLDWCSGVIARLEAGDFVMAGERR
jgi:DNA-binding PadR family transcriptional regulator